MTESFETYRTYLFAIAYRMLGSAMDAEDMVQETYLRYLSTPKDSIGSLKALLTTIISRLCVDQLHLARRKREQYLGPWLPEPIITAGKLQVSNPEERVDREESISMAFLLVLEQLQPLERAVFLLREVFEYDYAEIASFLGKSEVACRQWFSRAKKHLGEHRPRFQASPDTQKQLLTGFLQAIRTGEMTPLMDMLAEDGGTTDSSHSYHCQSGEARPRLIGNARMREEQLSRKGPSLWKKQRHSRLPAWS
jgi:RNA polymerase sigma-70 factor (ECF subfamily)